MKYRVSTGATSSIYEAATPDDAILAYVNDAGYSSVEKAAEAEGQTVGDFVAEITVEPISDFDQY